MSRLPILDKIALLGSMIIDIFKQSFTSLNGALLMVVSILQGISIAAVIFTAKNNRDNEKNCISTSRTKRNCINCRNNWTRLRSLRNITNLANCNPIFLGSCRRHRCKYRQHNSSFISFTAQFILAI